MIIPVLEIITYDKLSMIFENITLLLYVITNNAILVYIHKTFIRTTQIYMTNDCTVHTTTDYYGLLLTTTDYY